MAQHQATACSPDELLGIDPDAEPHPGYFENGPDFWRSHED